MDKNNNAIIGEKDTNHVILSDHDAVRELLCLLQGESGKYLKFTQTNHNNIKLMDCLESNETIIVNKNYIQLIKRLSIFGKSFCKLQNKCQTIISNNENDWFRKQFVLGLQQILKEHWNFLTKLHENRSMTLLQLNALVLKECRKFEYLLDTVKIIEILNSDYNNALVCLFEMTNCGDELIEKSMTSLFKITMKPIWTIISDWIMQKNHSYKMFNNFFHQTQHGLVLNKESLPKFVQENILQLIINFGISNRIFKQLMPENQIELIEYKLKLMFEEINLDELTGKNNHLKMNLLQEKLQMTYIELNQFLFEKIVIQKDKTFQITLQSIKGFFFQIFNSDLKSLQMFELDSLSNDSLSNKYILSLLLNHPDSWNVLLSNKSNQIYRNIFDQLLNLKLTLQAILISWKDVFHFYKENMYTIEINIYPFLKNILLTINHFICILMDKQKEIAFLIKIELNKLEESLFNKNQNILNFKIIHNRFIKRINIEINQQLQDKNFQSIMKNLNEFRDKISEFIEMTIDTYKKEQGKWHEEKLMIRDKYFAYTKDLVNYLIKIRQIKNKI